MLFKVNSLLLFWVSKSVNLCIVGQSLVFSTIKDTEVE